MLKGFLAKSLIMSGTSSQSWNNDDVYPQYLYLSFSPLSISSSFPISHLIRLAPILSPLGHFLIPSAHIHIVLSAIKPHSSYLCLYPLTLPPSIYLPPLPPALSFNPSIQLLTHFPPLCICFFLGSFESLIISICHSLFSMGCIYSI